MKSKNTDKIIASEQDMEVFMNAIINPPEPNDALKMAVKEFDQKFDNGENITKYLEPSVKDLVKGTTAKFSYFCAGNMYYTIDYNGSTYLFHINTEPNEVGLGEFYNEMKAIYLMRWIRKCQESGELIKIS